MSGSFFLPLALVAISAAPIAGMFALLGEDPERAGVKRSLATIERNYATALDAERDRSFNERVGEPLARRLGSLGRALTPAGGVTRLERQLDYAGNPAGWPVTRVVAVKGVAAVLGLVGGCLFGVMLGGTRAVILGGVGGALLGFFGPDLAVYNTGAKRQAEIRMSLPDVLDTLTVSVEAGQGFDAALAQVSRNGRGPIVGEAARVLQEMRIGKSRVEALRGMSARTTVEELRGFASAVVQASELGVPIGKVLREQAKEMRLRRRQHAEEQAQKVPIKILFPTLFCIFPALFVVVLGPGVINVMHAFSGR